MLSWPDDCAHADPPFHIVSVIISFLLIRFSLIQPKEQRCAGYPRQFLFIHSSIRIPHMYIKKVMCFKKIEFI